MVRILAGTREGLHAFGDGRVMGPRRIGWEGSPAGVTALASAGDDGVLAVVGRREIWRSADGEAWSHVVSIGNLEVECLAATDVGVLVGSAGAHLAFLAGPPTPLRTVESFDRVEGRERWYTPWGGPPSVRSIAGAGGSVFVNVHVGGIPRSRDAGQTWEPTIDIDTDVHEVWAGESGVFAACAYGLAVSRDQGETWGIEDEGLRSTYCRAVTVCEETVLVSASDGPRGGHACVYRRPLAGGWLEPCRSGLPGWFHGNIDTGCLDAAADLVAFGTPDGRVFASQDEGVTWQEVAAGLPPILCLLVRP